MGIVRFAYVTFSLLGLMFIVATGVAAYKDSGTSFLFGFGAFALLTISMGELTFPTKAPYRPPNA